MRQWFIILAILPIFFFSCKQDKVIKPKSILSKQAMTEVLVDMHIADAHINLATTPQDSARQLLTGAYQTIFEEHQINQDQFNESYQWYVNHTDELDDIYEDVVSLLEEQKDALE